MVLECHRCENSFSWECEISWRCQWRLISRGSGRLCGNWWLYTHPNTKACWVEVQGGCCISLSVLFDSLFSFKQLEAAFSYIGSLRCRRPMENNNPACVRNTHTHTHTQRVWILRRMFHGNTHTHWSLSTRLVPELVHRRGIYRPLSELTRDSFDLIDRMRMLLMVLWNKHGGLWLHKVYS